MGSWKIIETRLPDIFCNSFLVQLNKSMLSELLTDNMAVPDSSLPGGDGIKLSKL